jgi:hypothetical protein
MKAENIVFETKVSGYKYIYDREGFVNVFDTDTKGDQCIYRSRANCSSQKEFEIEVIYVGQKVYELTFG